MRQDTVTDSLEQTAPKRAEQLTLLHETTFLLMRQHQVDVRRAIEPLGLVPPTAFTLMMLALESIEHPKDLAGLLDVPPSMVSVILRQLQQRGLVQRSTDPADRRRVLLSITEEGHAMIERITTAWTEASSDRVARLDDDQLAELIHIQKVLLGQVA